MNEYQVLLSVNPKHLANILIGAIDKTAQNSSVEAQLKDAEFEKERE